MPEARTSPTSPPSGNVDPELIGDEDTTTSPTSPPSGNVDPELVGDPEKPVVVKKGDKVKTTARVDYRTQLDGKPVTLASFVNNETYDVIQVGAKGRPDDYVVIGKGKQVTAAVRMSELTVISNTAKPTPKPSEDKDTKPAEEIKDTINVAEITANITNAIVSNLSNPALMGASIAALVGSKVQTVNGRVDASTKYSDDYSYTVNKINEARSARDDYIEKLDRNDPSIVQNPDGFPTTHGISDKGYYTYDYYMDYEKDGLMSGIKTDNDNAIRRSLNIDIMSRSKLFKNYTEYYNRYKLANANDMLAKSFAHVFFVRPDCNIFKDSWKGDTLTKDLENLSEFYYAKKHSMNLLRQLTQTEAGYDHEFMPFLSNKAETFEVSDEYINAGTYGESVTGYKVPYGKSNVESRTSGKFSVTYHDDRDLHIYHLHRLWTNYISYVYRGKISPKDIYIMNKIIDYATSVYYILTAEDGETIIFWSKYWGVFPLEAPSSGFSYTKDNAGGVFSPELKIEYQYAWKEDFNPLTLIEFNSHTENLPFMYIPSYQASKLGTGYTWGGMPFVETVNNNDSLELPYTFKLRFRKGESANYILNTNIKGATKNSSGVPTFIPNTAIEKNNKDNRDIFSKIGSRLGSFSVFSILDKFL